MLKVMPGHERSVYSLLSRMEGIKDVYHLFGEYDFFVVMQAEEMMTLDKLAKKVQGIEEITKAWKMLITIEGDLIPGQTHMRGAQACIQEDEAEYSETAYS